MKKRSGKKIKIVEPSQEFENETELTQDDLEGVSGGFNPQPEPPGRSKSGPQNNPVQNQLNLKVNPAIKKSGDGSVKILIGL